MFNSTDIMILQHTDCSNIQQWYKVDGEHFEAVSLNVTIAHNKLQAFSPKYQHRK